MGIPVVDQMSNAIGGSGVDIQGYEQLYPSYETGISNKGILLVFPIGDLQAPIYSTEGNTADIMGDIMSGAEVGLGSILEAEKDSFEIPFMYNPTKYSEKKGINWKEYNVEMKKTLRKYMGSEAKEIKMTLFADASWGGVAGPIEGRGVRNDVLNNMSYKIAWGTKFAPLMRPTVAHYCNLWKALVLDEEAAQDPVVKEKFGRIINKPPFCVLAIGSHFEYQVVLSNVDVTYEMFDNALNPIRASIDLTFHEVYGSSFNEFYDSVQIELAGQWTSSTAYSGYGLRQLGRITRGII